MATLKTHFQVGLGDDAKAACGRGSRMSLNTPRVDCNSCIIRNSFQEAHQTYNLAKEAVFKAQEPRSYMEPWHQDGSYVICRECGNGHFRMGERTCHGHYQNFHCASCGHVESRLTETGISF